ncbi:MAG: response regulator, partial [Bdellovibrionales bacterium]|nr:response regulator [Bdellovibrionales bacterium]
MRRLLYQKSIYYSILLPAILAGAVLMVILIGVHSYIGHRQELQAQQENLRDIMTQANSSLSRSVWDGDQRDVELFAEGTLRGRDIIEVVVFESAKREWDTKSTSVKEIYRTDQPYHEEYSLSTHVIPLILVQDDGVLVGHVGEMHLRVTQRFVHQTLIERGWQLVIGYGVAIAVVILVMMGLLYYYVLSKMAVMANHLEQVAPNQDGHKFLSPELWCTISNSEVAIVGDRINRLLRRYFDAQQSTNNCLAERTKELELTQSLAQIGSWRYKIEQRTWDWSDQMFSILNVPYSKVPPSFDDFSSFIYEEDRHVWDNAIVDVLLKDQPLRTLFRVEVGVNSLVWIDAVLQREIDGRDLVSVTSIVGTFQGITKDIEQTNRMQLQNDYQLQIFSLASVGQIAKSITRELEQPFDELDRQLAALNSAMAKSDIYDVDTTKVVQQVNDTGEKIKRMLEDFRSLSGSGSGWSGNLEVSSIRDIVVESILSVSDIFYSVGIEIATVSLTLNSLEVRVVPRRLQQALVNLLLNCADALAGRDSGKVVISYDLIEATDKDTMIELKIQDNGTGISPHVREQIFDPFFTTRDVGQESNVGIGLTLTQTTVAEFGGELHMESLLGEGSTFTITLPLVKDISYKLGLVESEDHIPKGIEMEDETKTDKMQPQEQNSASASEDKKKVIGDVPLPYHILLVDDEEGIRECLQEGLELMGAKVTCASDGQEALDIFQNDSDDIDIILSDINMPRLDGLGLLKEVRKIHSEGRPYIYFMTGGMELELGGEVAESSYSGYFF